MKRPLDVVKETIATLKSSVTSATLSKLSVEEKVLAQLRKDLKLKADDAVVIDGVQIVVFEDPREPELMRATTYATIRWHTYELTVSKAREVLGALSLEELKDINLVSVIVDQYMDSIDAEDPVEDMAADEVDDLRAALKDIGIDDPSI